MKKVVPKRSYPKSKIGFFQQMKKSRTLLLMLMPAVVLVFIFAYIPMGGVILAFKQFRYDLGIFGSRLWDGIIKFSFSLGCAECYQKHSVV